MRDALFKSFPVQLFISPDGDVNEIVSAVRLEAPIKLSADESRSLGDIGFYVLPLLHKLLFLTLMDCEHVNQGHRHRASPCYLQSFTSLLGIL